MKVSTKKQLLFASMFLSIFGLLTGLCFAETRSILNAGKVAEESQIPNVEPLKMEVSVAVGSNGRIILPDPEARYNTNMDTANEAPVLNPTQELLQEKAQAKAMSDAVLPPAPAIDVPTPIEDVQAPAIENSTPVENSSAPIQVTVQKPILPDPSGDTEPVATTPAPATQVPVAVATTPAATTPAPATAVPAPATTVAVPSPAPVPCTSCGCDSGQCACCEKTFGQFIREDIKWSGYINAGYDSNFSGDRSNGFVDCWNSTDPALNGLYIAAEKKAFTGGCGADWGFGVDFMFGEDSRLLESARGFDDSWDTGSMYNTRTGLYDRNSYGFAMPQLYAEVAINNWSVKLGHFYGLLGYESVKASDRFFYTKGLGFQVTPITQTGVLASYNGFQNLDITLGWVNGWGNGFDNSDYAEGMITGAFTYRVNQFASIKYAFQSGTADMSGVCGFAGPYTNALYVGKGVGAMHNVNFIVKLNPCLEAVTTIHYGDYGQATNTNNGDRFLVIGEHLYRTINCCWKVGMRFEWMKNTVYTTHGNADDEVISLTFGANWHPAGNQNLAIRPELRYDSVTGANSGIILNGRPDQITMGFDVMYKF